MNGDLILLPVRIQPANPRRFRRPADPRHVANLRALAPSRRSVVDIYDWATDPELATDPAPRGWVDDGFFHTDLG